MEHGFAGRISGASDGYNGFPMVTYCKCGLGFYGKNTDIADNRYSAHRKEVDVPPGQLVPPREDIRALLGYNWRDEETDYEDADDKTGHIFLAMQRIAAWLDRSK